MTYDAVNQIITEKDHDVRKQYQEITPMLDLAQDLSNRLIQMRKRRGEIDFDISEAKVLVNNEGLPTDVVLRERGEGERLINAMLLTKRLQNISINLKFLSFTVFTNNLNQID